MLNTTTAKSLIADIGTRSGSTALMAPTDKQIATAYEEAIAAENNYALKAVICGQLLLEKREAMARVSHSEKPSPNGRNQHSPANEPRFIKSLESLKMSVPKAYRWMDCAERVARVQLKLPTAFPMVNFIDVEGVAIPLSQALTAPPKELPASALKFREGVFAFMEDKTLSEALAASVDGESEPHRFTRAAAGKGQGGGGEQDRKEFEKFTALKLRHITSFLAKKLSQTQKALIVASFHAALQLWPRWLLEAIAEKCKAELKLSDAERAARES